MSQLDESVSSVSLAVQPLSIVCQYVIKSRHHCKKHYANYCQKDCSCLEHYSSLQSIGQNLIKTQVAFHHMTGHDIWTLTQAKPDWVDIKANR